MLAGAGAAYVLAWAVGPLAAPSAPSSTASASVVHAYYVENARAALTQSGLVHGVAGMALIVLAVMLARLTLTAGVLRRWVVASGCAAAAVSFLQVGIEVAATARPAGQEACTA